MSQFKRNFTKFLQILQNLKFYKISDLSRFPAKTSHHHFLDSKFMAPYIIRDYIKDNVGLTLNLR